MPPPPPGVADLFGWILWLILIGLFVAGLLAFIKYISRSLSIYNGATVASQYDELEKTMKELLEEIRLLRKEIEALRRELRG